VGKVAFSQIGIVPERSGKDPLTSILMLNCCDGLSLLAIGVKNYLRKTVEIKKADIVEDVLIHGITGGNDLWWDFSKKLLREAPAAAGWVLKKMQMQIKALLPHQ
jgi:hypothetical protein